VNDDDVVQICKKEAILSSNTSSISITRLAAATTRPENVVSCPPLLP
jgi:3-hydroxyacyl-CoA dehydrogenase